MQPRRTPVLVVLAGLPGTGKTTLARELARRTGAVHLRIDTIEHALASSGKLAGPVHDLGYRLAYAIAADNLRAGNSVIGDSVNPISVTREAWRSVAADCRALLLEVEATCSDAVEHRRRVEKRVPDMAGFKVPTWQEVVDREYEPWEEAAIRVDTTTSDLDAIVARIADAMGASQA